MQRDRQAKLDEMMTHRWVLLARFAEVVPGFSSRTLRSWAEAGKLPCSKRFASRWWIDVRAFMALRRDQSEDLMSA